MIVCVAVPMDAHGNQTVLFTFSPGFAQPATSPWGKNIAYTGTIVQS
jgi:hypothetical protein